MRQRYLYFSFTWQKFTALGGTVKRSREQASIRVVAWTRPLGRVAAERLFDCQALSAFATAKDRERGNTACRAPFGAVLDRATP